MGMSDEHAQVNLMRLQQSGGATIKQLLFYADFSSPFVKLVKPGGKSSVLSHATS